MLRILLLYGKVPGIITPVDAGAKCLMSRVLPYLSWHRP